MKICKNPSCANEIAEDRTYCSRTCALTNGRKAGPNSNGLTLKILNNKLEMQITIQQNIIKELEIRIEELERYKSKQIIAWNQHLFQESKQDLNMEYLEQLVNQLK